MLAFRIGSIPVQVRPTHLLIGAFIAWTWVPAVRTGELHLALLGLLGGMFVVFVSILVHELGHATVARLYGYQPEIVIEWFGGHTQPNAPGPIPWVKDVLLTFAGPLFGFLLGIASAVAFFALGGQLEVRADAPLVHQLLFVFMAANILWAILNLMPVLPLDGGRISHAVLTRIFGRHGVLFSQGIALLICAGLVAWGASMNAPILAIFFALWGWQAVKLLMAYFKGTGGGQITPAPSDLVFAQAAALFHEGKYAEARRAAEQALQKDTSREAAARLHHLLGWVSVKDGRGHDALEHFARVDTHSVEPHALAAAHSLAGDDARALPLWELSYRTAKDQTLLHEWAGALIRMGRASEARRLSGVDLLEAYRAAEGVLLQRGEYAAAARLGEEALREVPRPEVAYNAACAWAKAGDERSTQRLLERAAELGFRDASYARQDPDLAAVRQSPWFDAWSQRVQGSAAR